MANPEDAKAVAELERIKRLLVAWERAREPRRWSLGMPTLEACRRRFLASRYKVRRILLGAMDVT